MWLVYTGYAHDTCDFAGGHLKPDYYYAAAGLAAEYGLDAAAEVTEFEHANLQAVSNFIVENNIDCDYIVTRAVDVQLGNDVYEKAKAGYELLRKLPTTKNVFAVPNNLAETVRMSISFRDSFNPFISIVVHWCLIAIIGLWCQEG